MLVLFDLDDTLLDDAKATAAAVTALHSHLESDRPLNAFRERWHASLQRHFARFLTGEINFQDQRRARIRDVVRSDLSDALADDIFSLYLSEYESRWSCFADVLPCLEALRDHDLGIVSNGNSDQQRQKLSSLGIRDFFRCVVVSEEVGCAKPDPRIFLKACELVGADPSHTIHVGDRFEVDVRGASCAGLHAVLLQRSGSEVPSRGHDFPIIRTLADLPSLVHDMAPSSTE